jgi:AcrR family transcriptional regulator
MSTTRKRGDTLEEAIYSAALNIFRERGIDGVSFAAIAKAARTSRSVLYRRWPTPIVLLHDAMHTQMSGGEGTLSDSTFDSGSLRQDLLDMFNQQARQMNAVDGIFLQAFIAEGAGGNSEVSAIYSQAERQNLAVVDRVLKEAHARGEAAAPETIPVTARLAGFRLIRYERLLSGQVSAGYVEALVDTVVLKAIE